MSCTALQMMTVGKIQTYRWIVHSNRPHFPIVNFHDMVPPAMRLDRESFFGHRRGVLTITDGVYMLGAAP